MAFETIDPRTGRPIGDHGTASQAIAFALNVGSEAEDFLRAWRDGSLEEFPEFYEWLKSPEGESA
jgi:hypothetical protein